MKNQHELYNVNVEKSNIKDDQKLVLLSFKDYYKNIDKYISKNKRSLYYQIIIVNSGYGVFWIDIESFEVSKESIIVYAEGQLQVLEDIKNIDGDVLLFSQQFLYSNSNDEEISENLGIIDLLSFTPPIIPSKEKYTDIMKIIKQLKVENSMMRDRIQSSIIHYLFRIFLFKVEQSLANQENIRLKDSSDYRIILLFRKLLEENYYRKKNVTFYASKLFITTKKLNEVIKGYINKTAKELINERIILETKRQLIHSDLTIKEIGYLVGFNDPTNFNKYFKKYIKQTPAEYRESTNP